MPPAERKSDAWKAAEIVRDAGGEVVGRTRLQKIAYLLELAGIGGGFRFEYKHYGPYSEALASATRNASLLGLLTEDERQASWGGYYSIFRAQIRRDEVVSQERCALARLAAAADPIVLELAATAAFLAASGERNAWEETVRRKPEKAQPDRVSQAKDLYARLRQIATPQQLPTVES